MDMKMPADGHNGMDKTSIIDKDSSTPIYAQLEDYIKEKIKAHEYLPGKAIPTEKELTELFGVSRMTIRQAIANLIHQGVLYRIPRKGAFVSKEVIEKKLEIESFSEDMRKKGLIPGSKVLSFQKIMSDEDVRAKLNLSHREAVYFLHRLRLANGEPMAIEYCYLPERYFPDIIKYNMEYCSLYEIIEEEYSIHFSYMKQSIMAVAMTKGEAEMLLQAPKGFGLQSTKVVYKDDENPIEYTRTIYHPEKYSYNMVLFK